MFDAEPADNPLADYTFVYVPYCTGDVHLGNLTKEFSPELTVDTSAWSTAMRHSRTSPTTSPMPPRSSSPARAPAPSPPRSTPASRPTCLPDAQITVYADGSGAYPDDPALNAGIGGLWGLYETMPAWEVNEGLTPEDWGYPPFWVQAGLHDPEIVMSRFDFAYDDVQTGFMQLIGADTSDVGAAMLANEAAIEAEGVVQHSFTAPGSNTRFPATTPSTRWRSVASCCRTGWPTSSPAKTSPTWPARNAETGAGDDGLTSVVVPTARAHFGPLRRDFAGIPTTPFITTLGVS